MQIKIKDVRLSFPYLFSPQKGTNDDGTPNGKDTYAATFLLEKKRHAATIAEINKAVAELKLDPKIKGKPCKHLPLRDGSEKSHVDGYDEDIVFITARSPRKVVVVDANMSPLAAEEGRPYAGCYVNAVIDVYPYVHPKSGAGISASLRAVQFKRDGDPFGEKPVDPTEVFQDESGEESL